MCILDSVVPDVGKEIQLVQDQRHEPSEWGSAAGMFRPSTESSNFKTQDQSSWFTPVVVQGSDRIKEGHGPRRTGQIVWTFELRR